MKSITTLIGILAFQSIALSQTNPSPQPIINLGECSLAYSTDVEAIIPENHSPLKCREIVIMSLPPLTQSVTLVHLEFGMTGSFTFKKDAALQLVDFKDVYIEDMLTGKIFDLKSSDSYTFNVNRRIPDRFVLHIDNMLSRYSLTLR